MRIQNEPAILLHSRPYSESSLILEIFSANYGRLGLMAKGARRLKSRSRGHLSLFQPLLIGWSGKGELPILTAVEVQRPLINLNAQNAFCGFYLNELLLKLLHRHDAYLNLFERYNDAIKQLADSVSVEPVLRLFEKHLLTELGYALILDRESNTQLPIQANEKYSYVPEQGPVRALDSNIVRLTIHGQTLIRLSEENLVGEIVLQESKQLLRSVLNRLLDGRSLKSRQFLSQINQYTNH